MERQPKEVLTSRSLNEKIGQLGKQLVNKLFISMKTAQIHEKGNVALNQPIQQVVEIIKELQSQTGADISLEIEDDCVLVNDVKLKMDIEGFISFIAVIEEFKKRQIGEITFKELGDGTGLRKFVWILVNVDTKGPEPFQTLKTEISKEGIAGIELEPMEAQKEAVAEVPADTKQRAQNTYLRTVSIVAEVMDSVKLRQSISLRKSKRLVQGLVDLILQDETTILGLTTIRSHDEYTYNHCVNVGILSMAIGQRLGYNRRQLTELGLAAIFHDIGKSDIPLEILNKPTEFTEEEWKIMRRHPVLGVKHLIKLKGLDPLAIKITIGGFEHHLNYDLSGYPKLSTKRDLTLFGRIISLVDCYDALTSSRVYNRIPFPPDKALKFMITKSGRAFDPLLLKVLINCLGIYPLGSLVILNTGEMAVVVQTNPHPEKVHRPKVKLVTDREGREFDGPLVDLAGINPNAAGQPNAIVKSVDAYKHRIDVGRYFL